MRVGKLGGLAEARDSITSDMAAIRSDVEDAARHVQVAAAIGIAVFALVGIGIIVALSRTGGQQ